MKIQIQSGQRFNQLMVIEEKEPFVLPSGQKNRAVLCKCDCGNEKVIRLMHITRGLIKSCGCIHEKHGHSDKRLYKTWRAMKDRIHNKTHNRSHRYQDRGIEICHKWDSSFVEFMKWALSNGYTDEKQIDRIDNNKGYYPSNCRFVDNVVNVNNREVTAYVTYKGVRYAFMDLIRKLGIEETHAPAIRARIERGWDIESAFDTKIRTGKYKKRHEANSEN